MQQSSPSLALPRTTASSGFWDCLKQHRRIRPAPGTTPGCEMVETRPRRLIRVIHLLPALKQKKATQRESAASEQNGDRLQQHRTTSDAAAVIERDDPRSDVTSSIVADVIRTAAEEDEDGMSSYDGDEHQDVDEPAVHRDRRSIRVYDFESPFHPKYRRQLSDVDLLKLEVFADWLMHAIVEEAVAECSAMREPALNSVNTRKDWRSVFRTRCDLQNGRVVFDKCSTGPSVSASDPRSNCISNHQQQHHVRSDLCTSNASICSRLDQGFENLGFQPEDTSETDYSRSSKLTPQGAGQGNDLQFSVHTSALRTRGLVESDGVPLNAIEPTSSFAYSPTGNNDASSQVGSSFQSSTWGSSTDSSLCYARFTSRKNRAKPLLFFIHGIGDSADLWRNQLEFFRVHGYETLALDLVGHGYSIAPSKPKAYLFHNILNDCLVIFDRYSQERNAVIGHSYGACFAAAVARHRSKQVSHLILLSGGGPFPLCPPPAKSSLPLSLISCLQCCSSCKSRRRRTYYMPSRKQARFVTRLDIPSYVLTNISKGQVWLEGDAAFHKQIAVPTLLVYGLRDPFITLVEECEMEKTIPRAFLELIPGASHMLMLDAPEEVNDMIHKFLKRWDR